MFDLPNSWSKKRLKHLFNYSLSSVDRQVHDDALKVSVCHYSNAYNNEKVSIDTALPEGTCTTGEFEKYKILKGDILVTKDSESPEDIGVPCLIEHDLENTVCGYHLGIIRSQTEIDTSFVFRYLQSSLVQSHFFCESFGVTRFSLGKPSVENLEIPLPPLEEQKLISRYLNKKTEQIDLLVEKIQKKIGLLKEQRASLINQCVTKGLDPNIKMRDSGIEWIGETPKHWEFKRLKFVSAHISEKRLPKDSQIKISPENVESHTGKIFNYFSNYDTEGQCFKSGDILFNKLRVYLNKVVLCDFDGLSMGEMIVIRPTKIQGHYLHRVLNSSGFIENVNSLSEGVKLPRSPIDGIFNSLIPVPSITEQAQISSYINSEALKIDQLVEKHIEQISLISEYRQSLISSVVTGAIRVTKSMI